MSSTRGRKVPEAPKGETKKADPPIPVIVDIHPINVVDSLWLPGELLEWGDEVMRCRYVAGGVEEVSWFWKTDVRPVDGG